MTHVRRFICWVMTGHVFDEWHPVVEQHQDTSWGPPQEHWTASGRALRFCGYCGTPDWSRFAPVVPEGDPR